VPSTVPVTPELGEKNVSVTTERLRTARKLCSQRLSLCVLSAGLVAALVLAGHAARPVSYVTFSVGGVGPILSDIPISPARCQIEKLDYPHFSKSVGGQTIKVNGRTQCNSTVPELTLSVSIVDPSNMHVVAKTMKKKVNSMWIENEDTWFTCKNTNPTTYQGMALGTSYEDGKIYEQILEGQPITRACGY
jgi:hypothetical protein